MRQRPAAPSVRHSERACGVTLPESCIPHPHHYLPDALTQGATCLVCGCAEDFGALHIPVEPRGPDNSAWQVGDIVRNPKTGGIFAVRRSYGRLEFLELYPTYAQDHAPVDAELLVRGGKACCRCLGCTS